MFLSARCIHRRSQNIEIKGWAIKKSSIIAYEGEPSFGFNDLETQCCVFVKEASSAAHIYGTTFVPDEGMTSIGPQWEESIWNDLKPTFDKAVCAGLNLLFWHTFTSSPKRESLPGAGVFRGHASESRCDVVDEAGPFVSYINRTPLLMQRGVPVADVLYCYGDEVPNFVRLKSSDPAKVLPGYDYDVTDEEVLVARAAQNRGTG